MVASRRHVTEAIGIDGATFRIIAWQLARWQSLGLPPAGNVLRFALDGSGAIDLSLTERQFSVRSVADVAPESWGGATVSAW